MLKIETMPIIDIDNICEDMKVPLQGFEFTQMAENGSYHVVSCHDDTLEELWEEYDWHKDKEPIYATRLYNQAKLIELLRDLGYCEDILVFVHW